MTQWPGNRKMKWCDMRKKDDKRRKKEAKTKQRKHDAMVLPAVVFQKTKKHLVYIRSGDYNFQKLTELCPSVNCNRLP